MLRCYIHMSFSQAVYVDLYEDYSTNKLLVTIRRFVSCCGWPKFFHSDQGSQLVAASNELKRAIEAIDKQRLVDLGIRHESEWKFSPPDAPWVNGATEALVKSVKKAISATIGDQILTFSELQTVMFEASQLVNQRPIGKHPSDPTEGSYLCPNDLRLGRSSPDVPQGPFKERSSIKHRFDFIQGLVNSFWIK